MVEKVGASGHSAELEPSRAVRPAWTWRDRAEAGAGAGGASKAGDEVNISAEAVRRRELREAVERAPAVRREVVDHFRRVVADGTYRVDSRAVAERMLNVLA